MSLDLAQLNWAAIGVATVLAQLISTVWFVVLFGEPWAREYGASSKQQHTKEVPPYTYGVGLLCTFTLVLSLALLQTALSVSSIGAALQLGLFVAVGFCIATGVPGQAFLRRWGVAWIALGSQTVMIIASSVVLAMWA